MSIVWWNPISQRLVSDTLALHGDSIRRTSKIKSLSGGRFVGSVGDPNIRESVGQDGVGLWPRISPNVKCQDGSAIIIEPTPRPKLWLMAVNGGSSTVQKLDVDQCIAIGSGAEIVPVLIDLGLSDEEIAKALVKRVHGIAAPFEWMSSSRQLNVLPDAVPEKELV